MNDLVEFLKHPDFKPLSGNTFSQKGKVFILVLMWMFIVMFGIAFIGGLVQSILGKPVMRHSGVTWFLFPQGQIVPRGWYVFLLLLWGPVHEEFTFRYAVSRFHLVKIKLSLAFVLSNCITFPLYICYLRDLFGTTPLRCFSLSYLLLVGIGALLFCLLSFFNRYLLLLKTGWDKHAGVVFYLSVLLFSLYHLETNPFLLVRLMIGGFFFGYVRIRLGMGYAIALHTINNIPPTVFRLFISLPLSMTP